MREDALVIFGVFLYLNYLSGGAERAKGIIHLGWIQFANKKNGKDVALTLKTFIISSLITFGLSFAIGYWFFAQKDDAKDQPQGEGQYAAPAETLPG